MKTILKIFSVIALSVLSANAENKILKIAIDGDINPVSAGFISTSIVQAENGHYECLIIQMDTPGGLLESTKTIVKDIMSSRVPVVVYIAPSGSGAVSAGVFITLSAHFAVMAKGTNIGAAHPVSIGSEQPDSSSIMKNKVTNWASAWIRGIAEKRGRNADWAEKAVRESVSITEHEALAENIIDGVCAREDSLLIWLHGRVVQLDSGPKTLATRDALIEVREMNWRYQLLYKISNPTIAYILMMLGFYGLFFELASPGAVLPGVAGGIFIILAFFAMQTLPLRAAGLALIVFAIILFILEVKVTSYGVLSIGGVIAMFFGSIMLYKETPGYSVKVDWRTALVFTLATAAFFVFALSKVRKAHLLKPTTGQEGLIDEIGTALTDVQQEGRIKIHGEIWNARCEEKINKGESVRVLGVEGLVLKITRRSN